MKDAIASLGTLMELEGYSGNHLSTLVIHSDLCQLLLNPSIQWSEYGRNVFLHIFLVLVF